MTWLPRPYRGVTMGGIPSMSRETPPGSPRRRPVPLLPGPAEGRVAEHERALGRTTAAAGGQVGVKDADGSHADARVTTETSTEQREEGSQPPMDTQAGSATDADIDAPQVSTADVDVDVHARAATVLGSRVRDIPDFPEPGIVFKDITPVLADPWAFGAVVESLAATARMLGATTIAAIEARGFLLAAPVAIGLGAGIIPIRKQGKLPSTTYSQSYELEYGTATLEIHDDAVRPGERVLLIDDVLATGGTAAAAHSLLRQCGAQVLGLAVLMELTFLPGRERVSPLDVSTILSI